MSIAVFAVVERPITARSCEGSVGKTMGHGGPFHLGLAKGQKCKLAIARRNGRVVMPGREVGKANNEDAEVAQTGGWMEPVIELFMF